MRNLVRDTRVFRGSDIHSDHYLLISKIDIQRKWYGCWNKESKKGEENKQETYKVKLLNDYSTQDLYKRRLRFYTHVEETKEGNEE